MSGNKVFQILLAVAMFCIMTTAVQAYEIADSFRNPLDNYAVTGYRFGENAYHAGEDAMATPLTDVYAFANGRVVDSLEDRQPKTGGYGQVIMIEHTLPDNSKIVSVYGHLNKTGYRVPKGTDVLKGDKIAKIGWRYENGDFGPHLHFAIRKGAHDGTWRYAGNVPLSGLSDFYKPSDYLNLIRTVNTNEVYRLSNLGNKAYVSATSMTSCSWRPIDVRLVSSTEMNSHSTFYPQSVCFAPGTFIKRSNNPDISLIKSYSDGSGTVKNNFRQRFTKWEAFIRAGGKSDLSNVKIVSDAEYNLHTQGKDLTYNGNY
jgi:hypothetical protein